MTSHTPHPVPVETFEDVGGVLVSLGVSVQIRCGCTVSLEHDYGHEEET